MLYVTSGWVVRTAAATQHLGLKIASRDEWQVLQSTAALGARTPLGEGLGTYEIRAGLY
jgi:hypothetical protein